ncbi:MAG: 4Fe-4S dicluster domain-containing protein [Candidatus Lokiarchaeota archaeon]|nr:4Fe-4S dicluster domain-containing protein [Candidatus Lokiarchaeota archaeon]
MPKLLTKGSKALFFQKNRCQGCEMCVVVCPTGVLELSDEYNMRAARVPRVKHGKEVSCILCQRCEFACPNWAIYVVDEQPGEQKPAGQDVKGAARV